MSCADGLGWGSIDDTTSKVTKTKEGNNVRQSRSTKAGLKFPVGRISRRLKHGKYAARIGAGAPVYLAAVLEYLAAEVLELAGNIARERKVRRIVPRHIAIAVGTDEEMKTLLTGIVFPDGGIIPKIPALEYVRTPMEGGEVSIHTRACSL
ncbi:histone-fold-containing protein [Infundibulicybe gibba]|nr:histone-fold-containing protein [Infundibulicybe gibba]